MNKKPDTSTHTLGLHENMVWTERSWKIQRLGWGLLVTYILMAALGVFGTGMASKKNIESDGYSVKYERFGRFEMPLEFRIQAPAVNGRVVVTVPQEFTGHYGIESITPEPETQSFRGGQIVLEFSADSPSLVVIQVEAEKPGLHSTTLSVNDKKFTISQFIYP